MDFIQVSRNLSRLKNIGIDYWVSRSENINNSTKNLLFLCIYFKNTYICPVPNSGAPNQHLP